MDPQIWEHLLVILPLDVQQVQAKLTELEPKGFRLAALVQIAIGGAPHIDGRGQFVEGQPAPAFLVTLVRPKIESPPDAPASNLIAEG